MIRPEENQWPDRPRGVSSPEAMGLGAPAIPSSHDVQRSEAAMETWYYLQQGASVGPLSRADIEGLVRVGTIARETMVWPGSGDWIPAASSALAPLFAPAAPPPPTAYAGAPIAPVKGKKDWLPKDPRTRTLVLIAIGILGILAIISGVRQMREGAGEMGSSDVRIQIMGCRGISADEVQCGFQNVGAERGRVCMDVVVICNDGRHVASTCSDAMDVGESTTKVVKGFSPGISATMACTNMVYENVRTKT